MIRRIRRERKTSGAIPAAKSQEMRGDQAVKKRRQYALVDNPDTTLVGANLPTRYARNVAILHAKTGKSKKEILQEALDMYFTAMVTGRLRV